MSIAGSQYVPDPHRDPLPHPLDGHHLQARSYNWFLTTHSLGAFIGPRSLIISHISSRWLLVSFKYNQQLPFSYRSLISIIFAVAFKWQFSSFTILYLYMAWLLYFSFYLNSIHNNFYTLDFNRNQIWIVSSSIFLISLALRLYHEYFKYFLYWVIWKA